MSGTRSAQSPLSGACSSSTMIVIRIAITPSLNASSRDLDTLSPPGGPARSNRHQGSISGAMSAPPISVLLPVRDGAAHLAECIASLVAQSEGDFEVIAVDDGSRDATPRLLREWA